MILKSTREVIAQALSLAGVANLDFLAFNTATNMVNSLYRMIYDQICSSEENYYIKTFDFEGNESFLPDDCYMIKRVSIMDNSGSRAVKDLVLSAGKQNIYGEYVLKNNKIYIHTTVNPKIRVEYCPEPQTLTAPPASVLIDIDPSTIKTIGKMVDEGFYYEDEDGNFYFYNFGQMASDLVSMMPDIEEKKLDYLDGKLIVDYEKQHFVFDDLQGNVKDVSLAITQDKKTVKKIVASSPYLLVSYDDKTISTYNGWRHTDLSLKADRGHATRGISLAIHTDDRTGYGQVFLDADDGRLYYASYVPDTVLDFPNTADFSYLEKLLAAQLASMAGTNSTWLEESLKSDEENFYKQLKMNRASNLRVNNIRGRYLTFGGV